MKVPDNASGERLSVLFYVSAVAITGSLVLGGGTRPGFLSDVVLQLLAIPLLLAAVWKIFDAPLTRQLRLALSFLIAVAAVPLFQLIPLPPALWSALPNRAPTTETFDLLGRQLPWLPISVSPHHTWLSALSLVPPLAIFLGTLLASYRERQLLSLVVLAIGIFSVFVGLIQLAQGPSSPLRFFEFTNTTEAVGFFANRNHFAALLYSLSLFAAAWAANAALYAGSTRDRKGYDTGPIVALVAAFTVLVVLVGAQAMARSRAGLGLAILALVGAFLLALPTRHRASGLTTVKLLAGSIALAVMFAAQFALYRMLERFGSDPLEDARIPFARNTFEAAKTYMPFGAGQGTFVPVYALFERPEDALIHAYANHAHNDILELWLESGILGMVLAALFAVWFVMRSIATWRRAPPDGARDIDTLLARAATVVIVLLIAHSFVDYPLRTGAMMAVMAFACALLVNPLGSAGSAVELQTAPRRVSVALEASSTAAPPIASAEVRSERQSQQTPVDLAWPAAWRQPSQQGPSKNQGRGPKQSSDN